MEFAADIIVASPGEPWVHLVAAVRLEPEARPEVVTALKRYMTRMRAPVGLLVTRDRITIYREIVQSSSDETIREVGSVATDQIPDLQPFAAGLRRNATDFDAAVRNWLKDLRHRLVQGFARGTDPIFAEHLMPALALGEIRAGGPRPARRAAG